LWHAVDKLRLLALWSLWNLNYIGYQHLEIAPLVN
jgi:hypothetical protein